MGRPSEISAENHEFPLFVNQDAAKAASYSRKIPLLVYFSSSVRGLGVGSEVVVHGLKVGQVTDVRLSYDPVKDTIVAPVRLEVAPERIVGVGQQVFKDAHEAVQTLVSKGFRASLQSGNLLTGEMLVSFEIVPDAPAVTVSEQDGAFVFPTTESGGLSGLQASAGELLRNVNAIPFASIGQDLAAMTKNMTALTNGPELQQTLNGLAGDNDRCAGRDEKLEHGYGSGVEATSRDSGHAASHIEAIKPTASLGRCGIRQRYTVSS